MQCPKRVCIMDAATCGIPLRVFELCPRVEVPCVPGPDSYAPRLSNKHITPRGTLEFPKTSKRGITCTRAPPGSCPSRWTPSRVAAPGCRVLRDRRGRNSLLTPGSMLPPETELGADMKVSRGLPVRRPRAWSTRDRLSGKGQADLDAAGLWPTRFQISSWRARAKNSGIGDWVFAVCSQ